MVYQKVISDRVAICSRFMRELTDCWELTGSKTAYHPQGDGQTERVNQELEQYNPTLVNERQDDWRGTSPTCGIPVQHHVHSALNVPFLLDTGRIPRMGFEPNQQRLIWSRSMSFTDA